MLAILVSVALTFLVGRIVILEVRCGRRSSALLAQTNQQIASLTKRAVDTYRDKYGKDPTGPYPVIDLGKTASKKP